MNLLNLNDEWSEYLENSYDLSELEKGYIAFIVRWFENWSSDQGLERSREVARLFWRQAILRKERASWQLQRWAHGMRWYLNRIESAQECGTERIRLVAA